MGKWCKEKPGLQIITFSPESETAFCRARLTWIDKSGLTKFQSFGSSLNIWSRFRFSQTLWDPLEADGDGSSSNETDDTEGKDSAWKEHGRIRKTPKISHFNYIQSIPCSLNEKRGYPWRRWHWWQFNSWPRWTWWDHLEDSINMI